MISERYNARETEPRWQRQWDDKAIFASKNDDVRPKYYVLKMFLDFLRAGLAEREKRKINWEPVDMTVLANEQVIDGRGWRSGTIVEQREMNQWVFKITRYAQELLDALDTLDRWPDKVRLMQ